MHQPNILPILNVLFFNALMLHIEHFNALNSFQATKRLCTRAGWIFIQRLSTKPKQRCNICRYYLSKGLKPTWLPTNKTRNVETDNTERENLILNPNIVDVRVVLNCYVFCELI
jgi:hypothetical protein